MTKLMVDKHARKIYAKHAIPVLAETVQKGYQDDTYRVKYELINSDHSTKAKFRVEDIFDFPKDKNVNARENEENKERKTYQKSLCIPKTKNDLIDEITDQGYIITYDPPGGDIVSSWQSVILY